MVAVDIYVNETTRHADVILPPTSALERDHYDLVFHALAVRNTARFTPALFAEAGGRRHDWEIFRELALRTRPAARTQAAAEARLVDGGRGCALSPARIVDLLLRTGRSRLSVRAAAQAARRRRPRPARAVPARSGC